MGDRHDYDDDVEKDVNTAGKDGFSRCEESGQEYHHHNIGTNKLFFHTN